MGNRVGDTVVQADSSCRRVQPWLWGCTLGGGVLCCQEPSLGDISLALNGWSKEVDWKSECVRKGWGG